MLPSASMATQVWFRNIRATIREIVEVRHPLVVFDRGTLVNHRIDPVKFMELHLPQDMFFRMLIVGNIEQGAAELHRGDTEDEPSAVYPVWSGDEDDLSTLEELIATPAGEDVAVCEDQSIPRAHRPVLGQEHRIVVTDLPPANTGPGRKFARILHELQVENPEVILHVHGSYSWRTMFGTAVRSVDVDARTDAAKKSVMLPIGKKVDANSVGKFPQWLNMFGFKAVDMQVPRNRCLYNLQSAIWAGKYYDENVKFRSQGKHTPDITSPDAVAALPQVASHKRSSYEDGDKFQCDTCSLANECKFYREGAVCSVPDSEPARLADYFDTRDSGLIIQGLGSLLRKQADRLEQGMQDEEFGEELDPEVSKSINSLFANGVKLAKLVNPDLSGGTKVGVFVNGGGGAAVATGSSANQLTAAIVAELEAKGVAREDITPEMIGEVLAPAARPAIDATATRSDS